MHACATSHRSAPSPATAKTTLETKMATKEASASLWQEKKFRRNSAKLAATAAEHGFRHGQGKAHRRRHRKDSGYEDDLPFDDVESGLLDLEQNFCPDTTYRRWNSVIGAYSAKAHSIITQEVLKMQEMTDLRREELDGAVAAGKKGHDDDYALQHRAWVMDKWRREMADIMEVTQDLIQCVANDIVETNSETEEEAGGGGSSGGWSGNGACSQDLGQILEEELMRGGRGGPEEAGLNVDEKTEMEQDEDDDEEKLFLVRASKKDVTAATSASKRGGGERGSDGQKSSPSRRNLIVDGDSVWQESGRGFTIQVERLEKTKGAAGDECHWRKDLESPIIWGDGGGRMAAGGKGRSDCSSSKADGNFASQRTADSEAEEEAEDIFCDWIHLLKQQHRQQRQNIDDIFWKICLESEQPRRRRASRGLDNQPFQDRPDIFVDRCELLEGTKANLRRSGRPQKCYWNIFNEWKRNLEPVEVGRGKKKRKSKSKKLWKKKNNRNKAKKEAQAKEKKKEETKVATVEPKNHAPAAENKCTKAVSAPPARQARKQIKEDGGVTAKTATGNFRWFGRPRRYSIHTIEDYFEEASHIFNDHGGHDYYYEECEDVHSMKVGSGGRRRSREDLEGGDGSMEVLCGSRASKRLRTAAEEKFFNHNENWRYIKEETDKSFDKITRNIEQRIREAFQKEDGSEGQLGLVEDADIFRDWRWNMEETVEDIYYDWIAVFNEYGGSGGGRDLLADEKKGHRMKAASRDWPLFSIEPWNCKGRAKAPGQRQEGRNNMAAKCQRRLLTKCRPKQPSARAFNF